MPPDGYGQLAMEVKSPQGRPLQLLRNDLESLTQQINMEAADQNIALDFYMAVSEKRLNP